MDETDYFVPRRFHIDDIYGERMRCSRWYIALGEVIKYVDVKLDVRKLTNGGDVKGTQY